MSDRLTDEEIAEIEQRVSAVADGPWIVRDASCPTCLREGSSEWRIDELESGQHDMFAREADALFVGGARTDIPRLISDLKAAREALESLIGRRDEGMMFSERIRKAIAALPKETGNV